MITITHTHADGTLIDGSRKGDGVYDVLKGLRDNWRYFPSIGRIGIGQSRDSNAQTWKIDRAAEALRKAGLEVTVTIDESQRRTFAEAEAERNERAEDRAERMAGYAANAAARSGAALSQARSMASAIPFGQPMMPDHYSYGRDRRYRDRIDANYRRGFAESDKADHYEHRAANAESYQESRESVPVTLRRIARLEADERRVKRDLAGRIEYVRNDQGDYKPKLVKPEGDYLARLQTRAADLADELAYWRGIVAAAQESGAAKVWGPDSISKGDFVRATHGYWYEVLRVSAKSVTVPDPMPLIGKTRIMSREAAQAASDARQFRRMYTQTMPYDRITARKTAAELAALVAEAERLDRIAELEQQRDAGNDYGEPEALELAELTGSASSTPGTGSHDRIAS